MTTNVYLHFGKVLHKGISVRVGQHCLYKGPNVRICQGTWHTWVIAGAQAVQHVTGYIGTSADAGLQAATVNTRPVMQLVHVPLYKLKDRANRQVRSHR
jgi:hypothetical protein